MGPESAPKTLDELRKKWHRGKPALLEHEDIDEMLDEAVAVGRAETAEETAKWKARYDIYYHEFPKMADKRDELAREVAALTQRVSGLEEDNGNGRAAWDVLKKERDELAQEVERLKVVVTSHAENPNFEFTAEEKAMLVSDDKICAIHSLRRRLGIDLVTAKRLCDRGRFW